MPQQPQQSSDVLVLVGSQNGLTVIPRPTALTRLHYFDGKFLRADDLTKEQAYLRSLVHLSNQAGGAGVVHGMDTSLSTTSDEIVVGAGMAIDPLGRVLLLPVTETRLDVAQLITASQGAAQAAPAADIASAGTFTECTVAAETPPTQTPQGSTLYLLTVGFAEALCGQEDVFGKLCEDACAKSTDRPYTIDGLVFRAVPLTLKTALAVSSAIALGKKHERSLVASAYYADEKARVADLISAAGLASTAWCQGARLICETDVALAIFARAGSTTGFLDAWSARRERMEAVARRYWAFKMAMRPWNVFLAQVLQFQCQLAEVLKGIAAPGGEPTPTPCADAFTQAIGLLTNLKSAIGDNPAAAIAAQLTALESFLAQAKSDVAVVETGTTLIDGGIVELPSAGYLPVTPSSIVAVNTQVRTLLGDGVDLRFCIVRPDYVPHALEEAQHMDRISLLQGLDDPTNKPEVDVLVPDGQILAFSGTDELLFQITIQPTLPVASDVAVQPEIQPVDAIGNFVEGPPILVAGPPVVAAIAIDGAARAERLSGRGGAVYVAGVLDKPVQLGSANNPTVYGSGAGWLTLRVEDNPFVAAIGDVIPASGSASAAVTVNGKNEWLKLAVNGTLRVLALSQLSSTQWQLTARLDSVLTSEVTDNGVPPATPTATPLSFKASATFTGAIDGGTLSATVSGVNAGDPPLFTLTTTWGGSPLQVALKLVTADANATSLGKADLLANSEVADPGNPAHALAVQAISSIATALADALFADTAEKLLFGAADSGGELVVRATRDWVLFHRRRSIQCGTEPPKTVLPPKKYQVFVLDQAAVNGTQAEFPTDASGVLGVLTGTSDADKALLRSVATPVQVVEFLGGRATPSTLDAVVQSAWQALAPAGEEIVLGVVATKGTEDSDTLELARLARLEQAVSLLSPATAGALSSALADVPAAFDVPGTDGFILCYLSKQECVTVYALDVDANTPSFDQYTVFDLVAEREPIATVHFDAGATVLSPSEKTALLNAWGTRQYQISGSFMASSATATQQTVANSRTEYLAQVLYGDGDFGGPSHYLPETVPDTGCPVILVVGTTPAQCQAVYAVELTPLAPGAAFVPNPMLATYFSPVLQALGGGIDGIGTGNSVLPSTLLGEVAFLAASTSVSGSMPDLQTAWNDWAAGLDATVEPAFYGVFSNAGFPGDLDLARASDVVLPAVAPAATYSYPGVDNPITLLPPGSSCSAAVIVLARPVYATVVIVDAFQSYATMSNALTVDRLESFLSDEGVTTTVLDGSDRPEARIRFNGDTPLAADVTQLMGVLSQWPADQFGRVFTAIALSIVPSASDQPRLDNLWAALIAPDAAGASLFPYAHAVQPEPEFLQGNDATTTAAIDTFKEGGARYVLFVFRTYGPVGVGVPVLVAGGNNNI